MSQPPVPQPPFPPPPPYESVPQPQERSCLVQLPASVRSASKVVQKLAVLTSTYSASFTPATSSDLADWGWLKCPTEKFHAALEFFGTITGGYFKYANVRVTFMHQGKRVAMSFLGIPDSTWMGLVVPFGAPVCSSSSFRGLFPTKVESVSVSSTSFDCATGGPVANGVYFYFSIVIDLHFATDSPRPTLEQLLRPSIHPYEIASYGKHVPCTTTDLVIFLVCTRLITSSPSSGQHTNTQTGIVGGNGTGQDIEMMLIMEKNGKWFLPAGHVERGQTFPDAAAMELIEESGYTLDRSYPLVPFDLVYGSGSYDGYGESTAPIHILYTGRIDDTKPPVEACDGLGIAWVRLDWILQALTSRSESPECLQELPKFGESQKDAAKFRKPWELWEVIGRFAKQFAPMAYKNIYEPLGPGVRQ